jgi:hypothetical protein
MSTAVSPVPPVDVSRLSPFEDATELLSDPSALRARADRDGFLFFRGLLDPDAVRDVRRACLDVLDQFGLRADGATGLDGRVNLDKLYAYPMEKMREDIGVPWDVYVALQKLPQFHRLPHHPDLLKVYRTLFGEDVFVHPRHIMRAMTSHPGLYATPPHQDFPLVQGSTMTWTAWAPFGDCVLEQGPLCILRGSHREGYLPIDPTGGAGGIAAQLCAKDTDWVGGDFAIGDVLTFTSLTVHRAVPGARRDEVRLSMDVRYQRKSDIIEERSLSNHGDVPWDEVYAGWSEADADLMYYWRPTPLEIAPWDDALMQPGDRRIC